MGRLFNRSLVGGSAHMRRLWKFVDKVAAYRDARVLVTGASSVGMKLVAQAIHVRSARHVLRVQLQQLLR
jgi:transcriptional regulator with GAF, ATPase, and Fis domain